MDNKVIVCHIQPGMLAQYVDIIDGNIIEHLKLQSPIPQIENDICSICEEYECYHIHLYGVEEMIQEGIVPALKEKLITKYNVKDYVIEVN